MRKIIINKPKVLFFLMLILIFNSGLVIKNSEDLNIINEKEAIIDIYTVKKGDTLWSLSDNYNYKNKVEFVMEIEKLNDITSYDIKPGYKLAIPVYEVK